MAGTRSVPIVLLAATVFLSSIAACSSNPTPEPRADAPRYDVPYALGPDDFLLNGKHYGAAAIAEALKDSGGGIHVIVLRGPMVTVGEIVAMLPALGDGRTCLFVQHPDGSFTKATIQPKGGPAVDQSFCPATAEVFSHVGGYPKGDAITFNFVPPRRIPETREST